MMYHGLERRRHKRIPLACPVRVSAGAGEPSPGKTADLSNGGAMVCLPRASAPARGSLVGVYLRVPRATANTYMLEEFTIRARVLRHEDSAADDTVAVALEFAKPLQLGLEV